MFFHGSVREVEKVHKPVRPERKPPPSSLKFQPETFSGTWWRIRKESNEGTRVLYAMLNLNPNPHNPPDL